jgi:hypothetical protein
MLAPRVALLLATALVAAGCTSPRGGKGRGAAPPAPEAKAPDPIEDRDVDVRSLSREDLQAFETSWRLFVAHDPRWERVRGDWLRRGGAAPYVLSENLFRYFWSASKYHKEDEIVRVGEEAARVGEPAVGYFAKVLVIDRWPLKEPVTLEQFDPESGSNEPLRRTYTHFDIDDGTRQDAAKVLTRIGAPAVKTLSSPAILRAKKPSVRTYGAYALGRIATDDAVAALASVLATSPEWKDRGAAAKALGFALRTNASARPPLEKALEDSDDFVRRKAREGLDGRTRLEF